MFAFMWSLIIIFALVYFSYHRVSLLTWTVGMLVVLGVATKFNGFTAAIVVSWLIYLLIAISFGIAKWRRNYISKPIFSVYKKIMPAMSRTERQAISAGTVTWEGDLFRGNPDWHKLLALPKATLTAEEQAFLDGPVETLCSMINDWDITHCRADLSPAVWDFIKQQGFFSLIIPKQYGGKQFSAYAHSQILTKVSGRSITVASTLAVPNSLGPAELLLHYGTK